MISFVFSFLAGVLELYSLICFIAVIITWIPGVKFTAFGRFIDSITEPYMGIFSRKGWFRIANVDLSPLVSIGILNIVSGLFSNIASSHNIFYSLFSTFVMGPLEICLSLISFLWLIIFIRWIILVANHGSTPYNSAWNNFDNSIMGFTYKISKIWTNKPISYQTSLLITWIVFAVIIALLGTGIGFGNGFLKILFRRSYFI
ncbi:MAG: YggT family protein [Treponema sp.]|nr:YggT family protein [Treponema sp.]